MHRTNGQRRIAVVQAKAVQAIKKAVANVLKDHARTGDPVAIWRDGRVVKVPAHRLRRARR